MAASTNVNGSSQASTSVKRAHDSSSDSEECSDGAAGGRPGGKGKVRKVNKSRSWPQSMDAHLVEAARRIPSCRHLQISFEGMLLTRKEAIAEYIRRRTGIVRTAGQVGGRMRTLQKRAETDGRSTFPDLVNNMVSSQDFAKIDFAETLGPDLFPLSASISLRQKGSRSVRDAATQTESSLATSAHPRPACACNAADARLPVLVPPYKVPTPQHPQSSLTAANTAPSLISLTVDASSAAHLAPALPTLPAAGISSTIDLVNLLLLEDGIFDLFFAELGESEKLDAAELDQAKLRLRDARSEIRRR